MRNVGIITGVLLVLVFVAAGAFQLFGPITGSSASAPNITLEMQNGTTTLQDFRGQPVVLNFWAKWCSFCRKEMPILEDLYQAYEAQGLRVIGVHRSSTESFQEGIAFAEELGVTYPLAKDPDGNIFDAFSGHSRITPMTVLIGPEGKVHETLIGPREKEQFEELIRLHFDINRPTTTDHGTRE